MVFTLISDTVIEVTTSSSRFTIKGIKDGDCIQAYPHQWSLDHLPPFLPPAPYVICNYILQTILLWSSCNSKLVHLIGDNHFICEVSVKQIRLGSMFNWLFIVWWKNFLPHPMCAWWTFGSYLVNWFLLYRLILQ